MNQIPEIINMFNGYNSGNKLIGVTGAVKLPSFDAIEEEINGAGILGSYSTAIPGFYASIVQEITFRTLDDDIFTLMSPLDPVELTFRASQQSTLKSTGALDYKGMRIVERGRFKGFDPGSLELGKKMGSTVKLELVYFLCEVNGFVKLEYDKLNERFVVNNVDLMEKVRGLC